jgi:hypothetical protein
MYLFQLSGCYANEATRNERGNYRRAKVLGSDGKELHGQECNESCFFTQNLQSCQLLFIRTEKRRKC